MSCMEHNSFMEQTTFIKNYSMPSSRISGHWNNSLSTGFLEWLRLLKCYMKTYRRQMSYNNRLIDWTNTTSIVIYTMKYYTYTITKHCYCWSYYSKLQYNYSVCTLHATYKLITIATFIAVYIPNQWYTIGYWCCIYIRT